MVRGLTTISCLVVAAIAVAALTPVAVAQQPDAHIKRPRPKAATSQNTQKPKPVARRAATPCSEYGAGFVRMAGSDTCVRVGGAVDFGVGMSR
jgi:hypothetical protein